MNASSNPSISISFPLPGYSEYRAFIALDRETALKALRRAEERRDFSLFDRYDDCCGFSVNENGIDGILVGDDWGHGAPGIEVYGWASSEGDDALDGTKVARELSLDDRLAVAALVRSLIA